MQMVFSDDETSGTTGMVHPGVLKDRVASPAGKQLIAIHAWWAAAAAAAATASAVRGNQAACLQMTSQRAHSSVCFSPLISLRTGTTIAGITELESSGVRGAFIRAVTRAAQRSKELAG